jgi:hypothetical protein
MRGSGVRSNDGDRRPRWRSFGCGFGLLTFEDSLERVARLGDVREIELRLGFNRRSGRAAATAAAAEVGTYPVSLIGVDGTGVGLSRDAEGFERIQNRPALDFQFSCKIVDADFGHSILLRAGGSRLALCSPAHLAVHISLNRSRSCEVQSYYPLKLDIFAAFSRSRSHNTAQNRSRSYPRSCPRSNSTVPFICLHLHPTFPGSDRPVRPSCHC